MAQTISTQDTFVLTGRIDRAVHKHALSHSSGVFRNYENELLIKANDLATNEVQVLSGLYMIDGTVIENTDVISIPATSNGVFLLVSDLDLNANTIETYLTDSIQYDDDLTVTPNGRKQLELATITVQNGNISSISRTIEFLETNWWTGFKNWATTTFFTKTESDTRYLKKTGDTATGQMVFENSSIGLDLKPLLNAGRWYLLRILINNVPRGDMAIDGNNFYYRGRTGDGTVKNMLIIPDDGPITYSQFGNSQTPMAFAEQTDITTINMFMTDGQERNLSLRKPMTNVKRIEVTFSAYNSGTVQDYGFDTAILTPRSGTWGQQTNIALNSGESDVEPTAKKFIITNDGRILGKTPVTMSNQGKLVIRTVTVIYDDKININS